MDSIIESLKQMNDEEAREYIALLFAGYSKRKKDGKLYEISDKIPKIIILTYYACIKKAMFTNMLEAFKEKYIPETNVKNFKERYLYNENKLEVVQMKEEEQGLRLVYDYVLEKHDLENISIYTLTDIHELLYSKTPHPEFGGKYRVEPAWLFNTSIETPNYYMIVREMNSLRDEVSNLVERGKDLGKNNSPDKLFDYISDCIKLMCTIIQIQPFANGNKRSTRAFINLLFRLANIPPVYIENKERDKYQEALQEAIINKDYSKLNHFYYYKICDSIISLDINLSNTYNKKYSEQKHVNSNDKKGAK